MWKSKQKYIKYLVQFKPECTRAIWAGFLEGRTVRELKAMAHTKRVELKAAA